VLPRIDDIVGRTDDDRVRILFRVLPRLERRRTAIRSGSLDVRRGLSDVLGQECNCRRHEASARGEPLRHRDDEKRNRHQQDDHGGAKLRYACDHCDSHDERRLRSQAEDDARGRVRLAGQDPEQAGLAGAVDAHQTGLVAGPDREGGAREQQAACDLHADVASL